MGKPMLEPGDYAKSKADGTIYKVLAIVRGFAIVKDRTGAGATIHVRSLEFVPSRQVEDWPNE